MSIYNARHNVLFIHVPKTAGSSMEQCDWLGGVGHWPVWSFPRFIAGLDGVFKFAFVRNPWDRFVSAFFHQPNITGYPQDRAGLRRFVLEKLEPLGELSPALEYPNLGDWPLHHHFLPMWFFVCKRDGDIGVDFVGYYEGLTEDWAIVCATMRVPDVLCQVRKTAHRPFRDYYDEETWGAVATAYRRDCELFGYGGETL